MQGILRGNFFPLPERGGFRYVLAMFDDDLDPKKKAAKLRNLEPMSVDELVAYVEDMKTEIARAEAEISKKKAYAQAASSFFKN